MIKIKHVIITLFNINIYSHDKSMKPVSTDLWLKNRFKLFDTYCFPSMKQQTAQDYIWLCFFDIGTLKEYKNKIEDYQKEVPQFVPCFLNQQETRRWKEYIPEKVASYVSDEDTYVVTTNLDNDDLFHKEALEVIQNRVRSELKPGLYVFTTGLQYFINSNMMIKMVYPHNHFMSLCEKNDKEKIQTVKFAKHGHIKKMVDSLFVMDDKPYWIETVHDKNVGNDVRITSRVRYSLIFNRICLRDYGLDMDFGKYRNIGSCIIFMPFLFVSACVNKVINKMLKRDREIK